MTDRIPWGRKEDRRREFKSAEALKKPEIIARGVVAMLNADGGEVWVGLRAERARVVAIEPIPDPERERRRLLDHLVDTIEPAPLGVEVMAEPVPSEDGTVLRVIAQPQPGRKPYARLHTGGRHFVIRVGSRIRPMTREEIFATTGEGFVEGRAVEQLREDREKLQQAGDSLFWLGLEPATEMDLDLHDPKLKSYLQDPIQSNNRRTGWTFATSTQPLILRKDKLSTAPAELHRAEIRRSGALRFMAPLESLHWKGESQEIWPSILLEYPVSAFRIARRIYGGRLTGEVRVDLALFRVQGWKLRPGSPGRWFLSNRISAFEDSDDLVWERPLTFSAEEIDREPDRCGYRLVERVYEAFGYRRDQ